MWNASADFADYTDECLVGVGMRPQISPITLMNAFSVLEYVRR